MIIQKRKSEIMYMTLGDAIWFAQLSGIIYDTYVSEHKEELFFLKVAKMLKDKGYNRAAGRCYVQALDHSIRNYMLSQFYPKHKCVSNYDKVYRIAVNFYVELGSISYLKELKKRYDNRLKEVNNERLWRELSEELLKKNELSNKINDLLDITGVR